MDTYKNRITSDNISEKDYILMNYDVLSNGTLINKRTQKIVKFSLTKDGYLKARLYSSLSKHEDGRKPYYLHRVIAMIYLDNYNINLTVNHKDGNKLNNDISNLEMATISENIIHSYRILNKKRR